RIAVLHDGRLAAEGSPDELKRLIPGGHVRLRVLEWLAAFGLLVLFATALTWIAVGMGLVSPNAEAAGNNAMPLILLPLLSSTFVPLDSMPGWFQPIAEYQPFTPAIETLRGLLLGTQIGHNGWLALAWCLGLAVLGYLWSTSKFNDDPK
ncbi:ABC transporter permease, partial [Streptomyces hawaiiensis]|uniref:ABC transporter permease n=1 Tax=Streptomyces hawaiiensis TaxID=67305 RepID=UPI0036577A26